MPDEEPDVGAGDEGLAAARDDDALDRRVRCRGVERVLELRHDDFVERVHRVRTIDRQRRDAIGDLRSDQREAERRARARLRLESRRHWQVPARGEVRDEIPGALDAGVVHQLERATSPPQADARADVGIFDRADAFVDERRRDIARRGSQAIRHRLETAPRPAFR